MKNLKKSRVGIIRGVSYGITGRIAHSGVGLCFFGIIVCIFVRCDVIRLSHKSNSAFIRFKTVEYV